MKILYDYQAFEMQEYGGVSKSFCELIKNLPKACTYEIGLKESNNIHLHNSNISDSISFNTLDKNQFITRKHFRGKYKLYNICNKYFNFIPTTYNKNRNYSIELLKEQNYDIFHPTFFDPYYIKHLKKKPFVLTIHDMIPELYPEFYKNCDQISLKKYLAPQASAIIAVSNQTKNDIIKFLNIPEDKITVIYHGCPETTTINTQTNRIIDEPYFLYVGTRLAYKNFSLLIKEFEQVVNTNKQIKLVCTGPDFTQEELLLIKKYNVTDNVISIRVTDIELGVLYSQAIAFIFPSSYEGFGMPILESFSYKCPIILNNASCFPEIAGEAAIYFNETNHYCNLGKQMIKTLNFTEEERQKQINKGLKQLSFYSWKKSAEKLFQVYSSIV